MAGNTVYVQGNYVDVHDNEVVNLNIDKANVNLNENEAPEETTVPEVLAESELWQKVKDAGLVDKAGQPTVSRTEAALLADTLATKLGIRNKWKTFEALWHRNNMRGDYNTALNQNKSLAFQDKLKNLLR